MYVKRMRVEGFSSFADSEWISLVRGINMIVGENNSGKSAILKAIAPVVEINKHRNEDRFFGGSLPDQVISLELAFTTSEFRQRLAQCNKSVQVTGDGATTLAQKQIENIFNKDQEIVLKCESRNGNTLSTKEPILQEMIELSQFCIYRLQMESGNLTVGNSGIGQSDTLIDAFIDYDSSAFFNFSAQRLNIARTPYSREVKLNSNASNLPAFLAYVSGNLPQQMREIESRVQEVMPSVQQITVDPTLNGYEILIWTSKNNNQRELAFSLDSCGTGVAQVIAIFSAVVTSKNNIFVVDEINSFLHPLATKKLMTILSTSYSSNQYIISSHSSDAISHPSVEQMVIVERDGYESAVKIIEPKNFIKVSSALRSLGISMGDVLGADGIIWVEGPTEEIAFTNLYQREIGPLPEGVRLSSVAATGDFERRRTSHKSVVGLYQRVTRSVAPMVVNQRFLLDRERLSDDEVAKSEQSTDRHLRFLPRRCLECYVLDPTSIAAVLSDELDEDIGADQITQEIASLALDVTFGAKTLFKGDITAEDWLKKVDAAKLLGRLFTNISEARLEFKKTHHTPLLLSKLPSERVKPLVDILATLVTEVAP